METPSLTPNENIKQETDYETSPKRKTPRHASIVKVKQEPECEADQCKNNSQDIIPKAHLADNEQKHVIEMEQESGDGVCETHSDDAVKSPKRDCITESEQIPNGWEMNAELCVDSTSCLLQNNVEIEANKKILRTGQPFSCDVCGTEFVVSVNISRNKRIHTKEKLYNCDECGLEFTQSENLKRHMKIHTGDKRMQGAQHLVVWVGKQKYCVYCKTSRSSFACKGCTKTPALCPKYCFEQYHTSSS